MRGNRRVGRLLAAALLGNLVFVVPAHAATVRHVPADYATISAAIAASSSGDTVQVAPGSYSDNFTVPSGITVESSAGPETTIVRGVGLAGPIAVVNAGATVRGLTLRDGGGNVDGGAAQVAGTLQDSLILDNTACYGPAIRLDGGTVQDSYFEGNESECFSPAVIRGNGSVIGNEFADNGHSPPIMINGASPTIERNYFHDPGVVLQLINLSNPVIRNNLVVATGAATDGLIELNHGLSSGDGAAFVNNTFILSSGNGPLVNTHGDDEFMTFENNILVGQAGSTLLKCTNDFDAAAPIVTTNDFWTPSGAATSGACAGVVGTAGNVSIDPKFVASATGDYHLRAYSPLIDAGTNAGAPSVDYDLEARPLDGNENGTAVVDIGFDESTLALGLSRDSIDFGTAAIFATTSQSITATNLGSTPISIDTISISGVPDFEVASETCPAGTLAVGASCSITIDFTPNDYAQRPGTLTIGGPGATGTLTVPLVGYGSYPFTITPDHFDYPNAVVGVPIAGTITVQNAGLPATILEITTVGANASDVTIGAQTCTAAPVPQNGSCSIPFSYKALNDGSRTLTINIRGESPFGEVNVPFSVNATFASSNVAWGSVTGATGSYTWNGGGALGRTVQSGAQRLHLAYVTDHVGGQWASDTGTRVGVYYVRNTSGTTWSTPLRLNPSTQHAATLGLAAAGSRVYAIWVSQTKWNGYSPTAPRRLYVRVNTSHGASTSWRTAVALTSSTGRVDYPVVAATGTDAHIAWTDAVTGTVHIASSRDYGVHWTNKSLGTTSVSFPDGYTAFPTVAASGSTVAVCWLSSTAGTIKCRVSADRGVSWATLTTVGSQANGFFSVAVRSSRIAVVWTTPNGGDVVVRQRVSGVWQPAKALPTPHNADNYYGAHVELQEGNRIAVTWSANYGPETALLWQESANGGALWFGIDNVSSVSSTRKRNDWPSVSWPTVGTRYVVENGWTENTLYYRLYLRKGSGTPTTPTSPTAAALEWSPGRPSTTVLDPGTFEASEGQR